LDDAHREPVMAYFQTGQSLSAWPMIRAALASVSNLAVIPMQDLLDLPNSARLNRPGTSEGNWQWRFKSEQLDRLMENYGDQIRYWHRLFDRTGKLKNRDYRVAPDLPAHP
jgi:4-alpha-glucanotransferase